MHQEDHGLEQRLSRFEAQLDRFSLALHQWHATQDQTHSSNASSIDARIQTLEETFVREAHGLRQLHEGPLKQLEAQAATLKDLCASAVQSLHGIEHAETGLIDLQTHLRVVLTDLSSTLQTLVPNTQLVAPTASSQTPEASWPLEGVVGLHDQLRRSATAADAFPHAPTRDATITSIQRYSSGRVDTAESSSQPLPAVESTAQPAASQPSGRRIPRWGYIAGGLIGLALFVVLAVVVVRRIDARLSDAAARVDAAERQISATTELATREVVAAREDADRRIAEARELARRAETVGAILTAPDLIRFTMTSVESDGSAAQLLWSRTHGLVLSGSRLPAVPPKSTYQLWLVTTTQPVNAGIFVPDEAGRATVVVDTPLNVRGRVVGASVTIEPDGGGAIPSGRTLLARFPAPSTPATP